MYKVSMKKKTQAQKWNEFTYGAWWIPFDIKDRTEIKKNQKPKTGRSDMMKYCPDCDNVYEINQYSRPRQIFYFSNVPKRQTAKTCSICDGKNYTIIKY